jgi:hypothetical protein
LIDKDDVAIVLDAAEDLTHQFRELGRALAGTAGEEEERIGLRIGPQRRQDDDVQVDLAALPGDAVFVDLESAAVGVNRRVVASTRFELLDRRDGLVWVAAGKQRQKA